MSRARRSEIGILILRVSLGLIFFLHGSEKLFGSGFSFVSEMLNMAGWILPVWLLLIVALVELLGGAALILGFAARPVALVLMLEMIVAVVLFHARQGFFIHTVPNAPLAYGFEFHLALIGGLLATSLAGPGAYAVWKAPFEWGRDA